MTDEAVIVPLPPASVQRICAGQAILDLTSCIKELLDNALDAGGTTINIRLFGKGGFDIVEVSDNGTGVPLASRPALALPHATSKLACLDDLTALQSYGFRGEALFSLCHVSQRLVIATRCADETVGEQLEFDSANNGALSTRQPMARTVGTTVAVVGLLARLPVRRKEFQQRLAAHVAKARQVVVEYALLHPGVAIRWMDMNNNASKVPRTVLATPSNTTRLRDTMGALWGNTALQSLIEFNVELPTNAAAGDDATDGTTAASTIRIHGWIGPGTQRSVIGLCRRPIDWPALGRALRDGYAPHQDATSSSNSNSIAWLVNIDMPPHLFDVNITPDKRTVLVIGQDEICSAVQTHVAALVPQQPLRQRRRFAFVHTPATSVQKEHEDRQQRNRHQDTTTTTTLQQDAVAAAAAAAALESSSDDESNHGEHMDASPSPATATMMEQTPTVPEPATLDDSCSENHDEDSSEDAETLKERVESPPQPRKRKFRHTVEAGMAPSVTPRDGNVSWKERRQWRQTQEQFNASTPSSATLERFGFRSASRAVSISGTKDQTEEEEVARRSVIERQASVVLRRRRSEDDEEPLPQQKAPHRKVSVGGRSGSSVVSPPTAPQDWTSAFGDTQSVLQAYRDDRAQRQAATPPQQDATQPDEDVPLAKQEFGTMQVLGQFNMGFILARSKDNSIWILDQHGCDEKYNFERLMSETVIHEQPLISPLPLELSAIQEACILDHMPMFERNGFRFRYDDTQPPRFRLSLTALPHSGAQDGRKAVQYGKDDVIALCSLLSGEDVDGGTGTDGTGLYGNNAVRRYATQPTLGETAETIMARLPKTVAMFASRACRNSIMIGTALSKKEMEKIVRRLADVDSPWNCPHGRPTVRRIGTLGQLVTEEDDNDYFGPVDREQHRKSASTP